MDQDAPDCLELFSDFLQVGKTEILWVYMLHQLMQVADGVQWKTSEDLHSEEWILL